MAVEGLTFPACSLVLTQEPSVTLTLLFTQAELHALQLLPHLKGNCRPPCAGLSLQRSLCPSSAHPSPGGHPHKIMAQQLPPGLKPTRARGGPHPREAPALGGQDWREGMQPGLRPQCPLCMLGVPLPPITSGLRGPQPHGWIYSGSVLHQVVPHQKQGSPPAAIPQSQQ